MGNTPSKIPTLQILKITENSISHSSNILPFIHTILQINNKPVVETSDGLEIMKLWEEGDLDFLIRDLRTSTNFNLVIPKKHEDIRLGISVKYLENVIDLFTVKILKIIDGSSAQKCGLLMYDYILGVEGVSLLNENGLLKYIENKKKQGMTLLVFNEKMNFIRKVFFKVEQGLSLYGCEIGLGILYSMPSDNRKINVEFDQNVINQKIKEFEENYPNEEVSEEEKEVKVINTENVEKDLQTVPDENLNKVSKNELLLQNEDKNSRIDIEKEADQLNKTIKGDMIENDDVSQDKKIKENEKSTLSEVDDKKTLNEEDESKGNEKSILSEGDYKKTLSEGDYKKTLNEEDEIEGDDKKTVSEGDDKKTVSEEDESEGNGEYESANLEEKIEENEKSTVSKIDNVNGDKTIEDNEKSTLSISEKTHEKINEEKSKSVLSENIKNDQDNRNKEEEKSTLGKRNESEVETNEKNEKNTSIKEDEKDDSKNQEKIDKKIQESTLSKIDDKIEDKNNDGNEKGELSKKDATDENLYEEKEKTGLSRENETEDKNNEGNEKSPLTKENEINSTSINDVETQDKINEGDEKSTLTKNDVKNEKSTLNRDEDLQDKIYEESDKSTINENESEIQKKIDKTTLRTKDEELQDMINEENEMSTISKGIEDNEKSTFSKIEDKIIEEDQKNTSSKGNKEGNSSEEDEKNTSSKGNESREKTNEAPVKRTITNEGNETSDLCKDSEKSQDKIISNENQDRIINEPEGEDSDKSKFDYMKEDKTLSEIFETQGKEINSNEDEKLNNNSIEQRETNLISGESRNISLNDVYSQEVESKIFDSQHDDNDKANKSAKSDDHKDDINRIDIGIQQNDKMNSLDEYNKKEERSSIPYEDSEKEANSHSEGIEKNYNLEDFSKMNLVANQNGKSSSLSEEHELGSEENINKNKISDKLNESQITKNSKLADVDPLSSFQKDSDIEESSKCVNETFQQDDDVDNINKITKKPSFDIPTDNNEELKLKKSRINEEIIKNHDSNSTAREHDDQKSDMHDREELADNDNTTRSLKDDTIKNASLVSENIDITKSLNNHDLDTKNMSKHVSVEGTVPSENVDMDSPNKEYSNINSKNLENSLNSSNIFSGTNLEKDLILKSDLSDLLNEQDINSSIQNTLSDINIEYGDLDINNKDKELSILTHEEIELSNNIKKTTDDTDKDFGSKLKDSYSSIKSKLSVKSNNPDSSHILSNTSRYNEELLQNDGVNGTKPDLSNRESSQNEKSKRESIFSIWSELSNSNKKSPEDLSNLDKKFPEDLHNSDKDFQINSHNSDKDFQINSHKSDKDFQINSQNLDKKFTGDLDHSNTELHETLSKLNEDSQNLDRNTTLPSNGPYLEGKSIDDFIPDKNKNISQTKNIQSSKEDHNFSKHLNLSNLASDHAIKSSDIKDNSKLYDTGKNIDNNGVSTEFVDKNLIVSSNIQNNDHTVIQLDKIQNFNKSYASGISGSDNDKLESKRKDMSFDKEDISYEKKDISFDKEDSSFKQGIKEEDNLLENQQSLNNDKSISKNKKDLEDEKFNDKLIEDEKFNDKLIENDRSMVHSKVSDKNISNQNIDKFTNQIFHSDISDINDSNNVNKYQSSFNKEEVLKIEDQKANSSFDSFMLDKEIFIEDTSKSIRLSEVIPNEDKYNQNRDGVNKDDKESFYIIDDTENDAMKKSVIIDLSEVNNKNDGSRTSNKTTNFFKDLSDNQEEEDFYDALNSMKQVENRSTLSESLNYNTKNTVVEKNIDSTFDDTLSDKQVIYNNVLDKETPYLSTDKETPYLSTDKETPYLSSDKETPYLSSDKEIPNSSPLDKEIPNSSPLDKEIPNSSPLDKEVNKNKTESVREIIYNSFSVLQSDSELESVQSTDRILDEYKTAFERKSLVDQYKEEENPVISSESSLKPGFVNELINKITSGVSTIRDTQEDIPGNKTNIEDLKDLKSKVLDYDINHQTEEEKLNISDNGDVLRILQEEDEEDFNLTDMNIHKSK